MKRGNLARVVLALWVTGTAAGASLTLDQRVQIFRRRAASLAAAHRWDAAIQQIQLAENAVHSARSAPRSASGSGEYRRELRKLQLWSREQALEVRKGHRTMAELQHDLITRKAALDRKFGGGGKPAPTPRATNERLDLLQASLEREEAGYCEGKRDRGAATLHRRRAAELQLRVYRDQKKPELAKQVVERLLQENASDPESLSLAAQRLQDAGEFARAAESWRSAIRLVESGKLPPASRPGRDTSTTRAHRLAVFYRQLAFCYAKLGKEAESRAALQAAARSDAVH